MRKFFPIIFLVIIPILTIQAQINIEAGTWETAAPMLTPRSETVAAALDGKIYVAGGMSGDGGGITDFEVYDPAIDEWQKLAPMPVGLHHLGIAAANGKIYIAGGYDSRDFRPDVAAMWEYDPAENTWAEVTEMPAPRAAHFMVEIEDKIYVVGGVGESADALWAYDTVTETWDTSPALLPTLREHLAAVALDGKLYVIGGRWSQGNLATLEVYDPETDTWESLSDMPVPAGGLTASAVNGKIHVAGGETFNPLATMNHHQVYDPETQTWERWPDLPTARHGLASASVEGKFYVIGGGTGAGPQTTQTMSTLVEVFTPSE